MGRCTETGLTKLSLFVAVYNVWAISSWSLGFTSRQYFSKDDLLNPMPGSMPLHRYFSPFPSNFHPFFVILQIVKKKLFEVFLARKLDDAGTIHQACW